MAGKQADIKVGVVTNYDDKGLKGAKNSLDNFKTAIADADGVGGKMKAGWGSVTDSVKANAGALAVAGGAALVAFGMKAVGAFTDTAKAALDLGSATGLAVEDASRWIAVGDDFEVGADQLASGIGKIAKSLDDSKWNTYGIATHNAAGEARDANDILTDSLAMLSGVTNETERARIGNELFGKGYANLAPLIGHTKDQYNEMLGSVEKGQVITTSEAKKAERFRLAQDQLGDAFQEVTIAIGEQVAALSPLIVKAAQLLAILGASGNDANDYADELADLREQYGLTAEQQADFFEAIYIGTKTIEQIREELAKTYGTLRDGEKSWETQTEWLDKVAEAASETDRETRRLTGAFEAVEQPVDTAARAVGRFKEMIAETDLAYRGLTGKLDEADAWENVVTKIGEAGDAAKLTGQDARDLTRDIADYVAHTDTIPASKKTEILALLDEGDIVAAELALANLTRTREIYLALTGPGAVTAAGYDGGKDGQRAAGGPVMAGGNYLVGEKGPEVVHMNGAGTVIPNDALGGGGTNIGEVHIHVQQMPTPNQLAEIAAKYTKRNGSAWLAS